MAVVAAGVHFARVDGGIAAGIPLGDGQGIRVSAKGDGVLASEVKKGAQRSLHGRKQAAPQRLQTVFQIVHGLGQIPVQFRDLVQRPAVLNQLHDHASPFFDMKYYT